MHWDPRYSFKYVGRFLTSYEFYITDAVNLGG